MGRAQYDPRYDDQRPWNAGKLVGAKKAFKQKQVWAMRFFLDYEHRVRDRALLDLAIDSKLRGCDVVKLRIGDLISGGQVKQRAVVVQQKTGKPVQFEIMEPARSSLLAWLNRRGETLDDFVFPVDATNPRISAPANMHASLMNGLWLQGYRRKITARIPCAEPRPR